MFENIKTRSMVELLEKSRDNRIKNKLIES